MRKKLPPPKRRDIWRSATSKRHVSELVEAVYRSLRRRKKLPSQASALQALMLLEPRPDAFNLFQAVDGYSVSANVHPLHTLVPFVRESYRTFDRHQTSWEQKKMAITPRSFFSIDDAHKSWKLWRTVFTQVLLRCTRSPSRRA